MDKLADADATLMSYITERVKSLDSKKQKLQKELRELEPLKTAKHCNVDEITNYMDKWDDLTIEDKMTVVDTLITVIKATETDVEITWKI